MAEETLLQSAVSSLDRIQGFDVSAIPRKDELGKSFNFEEAVPNAERLINLFKKIPKDALSQFPDSQLTSVKNEAGSDLFEKIIDFDATQAEATTARTRILTSVESHYQRAFNTLMPLISYGVAQTVDFARLETDGRAVLQGIKDETDSVLSDLEAAKGSANSVLDEIKKTAAEQGVSQQAFHFSQESSEHSKLAGEWRASTRNWAIAMIVYGVASFFFHKIPWIAPSGISEAIVFVASKVLIFVILSYMLVLSARNFLSHKHNAVVNKHRQNALMTYNALVSASGGKETQDIVLTHASACIFAAQDTGYTKHGGANNSPIANVVEMLPKTSIRVDGS